ncbi:DNA methyltransferase [Snodgrassella alvi]|uniref:DNA methyltransferase n=1 Tax=Snodgrassella alvi TaxID=1196083 RepID=UPI003516FA02
MQTKLIKEINGILKDFSEYWEEGTLQRTKVVNDIKERKPALIKALIKNYKIKSLYSTEIDGMLIFDFHALINLLQYKEYWADSFTKYRNRIGLTSEGKYINYNSDIVLDFPFKDCVLEGGMTKEEQGKNEVFYNEIIARDEIDRLFSPKVFSNIKLYTKEGVEEYNTQFHYNKNLIIKGNNLIALHSIKKRYAGKVKLIYIDPPYNTGKDSFKYNDRFNHSTWLTFIKNRLEIARELLSDNGVIFVHCDDNEQAYLKVLMDSIFNRINFISTLVIKGGSGRQDSANYAKTHEFIITYAKKIDSFTLNKKETEDTSSYTKVDESGRKYKTQLLRKWGSNDTRQARPNLYFPIVFNGETFLPVNGSGKDGRWRWRLEKINSAIEQKLIEAGTTLSGKRELYEKIYQDDAYKKLMTYTSILEGNFEDSYSGKGSRELEKLFESKIFNNPKSELLLKQIIEMVTDEKDIILDFYLGSGTTAAVAHKMKRQYIGIEQMDYINEVTIPRLQKVIEGERGGISKEVNWQGGGSFVYAELKELNYSYINDIQAAKNYQELSQLFEIMKQTAHLNYQVELEKILTTEHEADDINHMVTFRELTLQQQKKLLIELLDKNQLYINADDMNDQTYKVSEQEKAFTKSFYGENLS